jgi:hypothetical protein
MASSPAHSFTCPCGDCHKKRVADGTQESYERELRANTDKVFASLKAEYHELTAPAPRVAEKEINPPLCYKCNKTRAWRGECIDCYMANHSKRVFERGEWRMPDTHNIRQGYYMEEEYYAQQHRRQRAESKQTQQKPLELDLVKGLFQTVQGVNFDDKCRHGEPFYACMSCSH